MFSDVGRRGKTGFKSLFIFLHIPGKLLFGISIGFPALLVCCSHLHLLMERGSIILFFSTWSNWKPTFWWVSVRSLSCTASQINVFSDLYLPIDSRKLAISRLPAVFSSVVFYWLEGLQRLIKRFIVSVLFVWFIEQTMHRNNDQARMSF